MPAETTPLSQQEKGVSDLTFDCLRSTAELYGDDAAREIAIGQIDGCSRYLHGDPDHEINAAVQRAAE